MKLIVPIKQVPESGAVKMDETTGTVIRKDSDAVVNPLDLYAVECALRIREKNGAECCALCMGPPNAEHALREVLAMGMEEALLVSDRAYAGSDTWATANILAEAVRTFGPFDLILCGERATDGDTGQVGPELAAALGLPMAGYVTEIREIRNDSIRVVLMAEGGRQEAELPLPALITVVKSIGEPRLPTLDGKMKARRMAIPKAGQGELKLAADQIGLAGSPTRVVKIFHPQLTRRCRLEFASDGKQIRRAVEQMNALIAERNG